MLQRLIVLAANGAPRRFTAWGTSPPARGHLQGDFKSPSERPLTGILGAADWSSAQTENGAEQPFLKPPGKGPTDPAPPRGAVSAGKPQSHRLFRSVLAAASGIFRFYPFATEINMSAG